MKIVSFEDEPDDLQKCSKFDDVLKEVYENQGKKEDLIDKLRVEYLSKSFVDEKGIPIKQVEIPIDTGETKTTRYEIYQYEDDYFIICQTLDKCSKWTKVDLLVYQYNLNAFSVT